jgi:CRP-like cAMP-binding protein
MIENLSLATANNLNKSQPLGPVVRTWYDQDMEDITMWYLKQIDLFKGLNAKQLEYVSSCFRNKKFTKDTELQSLHQADTIFLLKKGVIELYAISEDGKKIIIDILGAGSVFGNLPESDSFEFSARVKKDCVICKMSSMKFFAMISKYPDVSEKLLKLLYSNVLVQKERISSLAVETVSERLVRLLKTLTTNIFPQHNVTFTHEELAQMIGTSRQTVTSLINALVKDGRVDKKGRQYRLVS